MSDFRAGLPIFWRTEILPVLKELFGVILVYAAVMSVPFMFFALLYGPSMPDWEVWLACGFALAWLSVLLWGLVRHIARLGGREYP